MKIKFFLLLFIAILITLTSTAQSWLWGQQSNGFEAIYIINDFGSLKSDGSGGNVVTNRMGNAYQTGEFISSITFGTTALTTSAASDMFLVKYDSSGNLLWAKQSESGGTFFGAGGYSVASDDSDNSYVTGITGPVTNFGIYQLGISNSVFFAKYDPNGNVLWAKQPYTEIVYSNSAGYAVTVDKFGHEYITGDGAFIIKYDRNGNIIWGLSQISNDVLATSIATDNSGNVYVTGIFQDNLTLGNYNLYTPSQAIYLEKLDSNGNILWAIQSNDIESDAAIATDKSGAIYLTGAFKNSISFGSYTLSCPDTATYNFFVIKFKTDASIIWGKADIPINSSNWTGYSLHTDDSNYIYVCGGTYIDSGIIIDNSALVFANDTFYVPNGGDTSDIPSFLLKLDSSGNVICGSALPSGGWPNGIATDSKGRFVYLGGEFYNTISFGNDHLESLNGGANFYVGRWQPCPSCQPESISVTKQGNNVLSSAAQGNQWLRNDTLIEGATSQSYAATVQGWYKVINMNPANDCVNVSDSIYVVPTSVNCVTIYPNPTFNNAIVNFCEQTTAINSYNLKVVDELGRVLYSNYSLNYNNVIDLNNLPAAMYFFVVTNNAGRTLVPVVKLTN